MNINSVSYQGFLLSLIFLTYLSGCNQKEQEKSDLNILSKKEIKEGWNLLFDGKSTENWRGVFKDTMPNYGWVIMENALSVNMEYDSTAPSGGDIITIDQFGDFDLRWEWRLMNKGDNSGLKYYYKEYDEEQNRYGLGLEYQILDDGDHEWMQEGKMKPNDYHTMGALYELYPPSETKKVLPLGEWNSSRVISNNNHVEHWLNGDKILEYERGSDDFKEKVSASKFRDAEGFGLFSEGHIMLQDHGGALQVRNMKIKELK
ncbi:DUF1080 domain-containing protein [Bacteroidota bacterium]